MRDENIDRIGGIDHPKEGEGGIVRPFCVTPTNTTFHPNRLVRSHRQHLSPLLREQTSKETPNAHKHYIRRTIVLPLLAR